MKANHEWIASKCYLIIHNNENILAVLLERPFSYKLHNFTRYTFQFR